MLKFSWSEYPTNEEVFQKTQGTQLLPTSPYQPNRKKPYIRVMFVHLSY